MNKFNRADKFWCFGHRIWLVLYCEIKNITYSLVNSILQCCQIFFMTINKFQLIQQTFIISYFSPCKSFRYFILFCSFYSLLDTFVDLRKGILFIRSSFLLNLFKKISSLSYVFKIEVYWIQQLIGYKLLAILVRVRRLAACKHDINLIVQTFFFANLHLDIIKYLTIYEVFISCDKTNLTIMSAGQNQLIMQEAINKATRLIELLSKENEDLKMKLRQSDEIIEVVTQNNQQSIDYNMKLKQQLSFTQQQMNRLKNQHADACHKISQLQASIFQKTNKNKQLHEKIGEIMAKTQQLTKNIEKQKKVNMSLQNQNQYLIKQLRNFEGKQNQLENYCSFTQIQFKRQLCNKERVKQAFARRCQEQRIQNSKLKQELYELQSMTNTKKIIKQRVDTGRFGGQQSDVKFNIEKNLNQIIKEILKMEPADQINEKFTQIKTFLVYRLQHIQKLISNIVEKIGRKSINIVDTNLKQILNATKRLVNYLQQMTEK